MNDSMSNVATALDALIECNQTAKAINYALNLNLITDIEILNPVDTLSEMIAKTMGVYPPRRVVTYRQ